MIDRIRDLSYLPSSSSSDFFYLLQGGRGFIRNLLFTNRRYKNMKYKNISVAFKKEDKKGN